MTDTLYKTLVGTAGAYGHGEWSMPTLNQDGTWTPSEWMPSQKPYLCRSGYHYCRNLVEVVIHLGPDICEIEVRGGIEEGGDKACASEARLLRRLWADTWTPEAQRLFAVDCARIAVNRYARADQRALLHGCLDIVVASVFDAEFRAARSAADSAADSAARSEQASLLQRYLDGEQGPFVEADDGQQEEE